MILLLAFGCEEPGTMSSVAATLADAAEADAQAPLRFSAAAAGLVAESCGGGPTADTATDTAGPSDECVFRSRSAAALGVCSPTITIDESSQTWTFDVVGLDGAEGTLDLVTDGNRENFALTYTAEGIRFTAGLELRDCDEGSAVVGGTGTWTTEAVAVAITVTGAAPTNGLGFTPTTAEVPTAGQIRAAAEAAGWVVLLDDASTVSPDAEAWPGKASGTGWQGDVEIAWP